MNGKKGLHIIGDFYDYKSTYGLDLEIIKKNISNKIVEVGLTELGNYYHDFGKDSYTGVICLAESHISIHTWPETNYLTLDIYVCNFGKNNTSKAHELLDFFQDFYSPNESNIKYVER